MSDDDKEPQGPFNPFIRFKNHVNSRIGTGVSVLTGANEDANRPAGDTQDNGPVQNAGSSSPCPAGSPSPWGPKRRSPTVEYWDDWCHVDPYSPHNLQHLPQPTPKDLPPGADPADFGYPEAFEDLMSASNPFRGHLMDLGMRAGLKKTASGGPVKPETPSAWVRRLYGDALLPHPFAWEQPRLAGGIPRHWEAHTRSPFGTQHAPEPNHETTSDLAKEFLDTIREIDGIVGESFSKMEELMGQDMTNMMRNVQKFAENVTNPFAEERSEDHGPSSNQVKTDGDAKAASVGKEDQPATEEDLYEYIEAISAQADRFLKDFFGGRTGPARPPEERPARDSPPVSTTVEHNLFGGKTIRTCSEHVDMFGFIHSRTEVRRLNAQGETTDYDTRYSVHSGPRGPNRPPQQEYRSHADPPVSGLMTPQQYSVFLQGCSDEQLEGCRVATAEADESGLSAEHLGLKKRQMQLITEEQRRRADQNALLNNPRLQDYQRQLMLLEMQNQRRLAMARQNAAHPGSNEHSRQDNAGFFGTTGAQNKPEPAVGREQAQDYERQLWLLEEQSRRRLERAREETAEAEARPPPPEKPQGSTNSERSGWFWR